MKFIRPALQCTTVLVLTLASNSAQQRPSPSAAASRTYPGEQEWIVADVSAAIHQMVTFAMHVPAPAGTVAVKAAQRTAGTLARFDVTLPGQKRVTLSITDHLWAPNAFVPIASRLSASTAEGCASLTTAPAVESLVTPRPDVLVRESARISARLQVDMRCADAHHEAALLLGTLALREAAGGFSDPRRMISRMTAHLAIAEAIDRGTTSTVKRLAGAVLLTLVGRQQSALDALGAVESAEPAAGVQPWVRALRLRNTFDPRTLPDGNRSTLLEQFSVLRALDTSLGDGPTVERFDTFEQAADVADWPRLLLQTHPGVQTGSRFTEPWLGAELSEAAEVLGAFDAAASLTDREAITHALNVEPTAGPVGSDGTVRVLDWGTWASAAQRHLMMAVYARHTHLASRVSLPGDARAFRDAASRMLSGLRLYPLAAVAVAYSRDEAAKAFPGLTSLAQSRPDLITHWGWRKLQAQAHYAVIGFPVRPRSWSVPPFPVGTAFDAANRSQPDDSVPRLDEPQIAEIRRRAPYSRQLVEEAVRRETAKPSYELLQREYGELATYDLQFARALATAAWDTPEIYIPQMERVCAMNADAYADLAPYLADHGRIEDARRAYGRWLDLGRNEVGISNGMAWLVRHYHEAGEHRKATAVADRAADVASFTGLITRANLHDWRGELDAAERLHRRAWRRYDNPHELLAFYLRHHRQGADVDELMHKIFPAGMTRMTTAASGVPPVDGIVVVVAGIAGAEEGIRPGDVVTAVDGIRVRNVPQYRVARGASASDTMRMTVWRGGAYLEVPARLRYRWVVSAVDTYRPTPGPRR
jgi:tetratricopeptide (TPR) repeat protein